MSMLFDYALSTIVSRSGAMPRNDPIRTLQQAESALFGLCTFSCQHCKMVVYLLCLVVVLVLLQ
jgi:hypothetical protein